MRINNIFPCFIKCLILILLGFGQIYISIYASVPELIKPLTIKNAIELAQNNDPWLEKNKFQQQSVDARSIEAGTLPDPVLSISLANLPTDTFDFNQEAMTQLVLGVAQQFPRGNSRKLSQQQLALIGMEYPLQREDRRAMTAVTVGQLWLDAYQAKETIKIINENKALFEHLVDIAQSSYSTMLDQDRQSDVISAQLELTRIEDRLLMMHEKQDSAMFRLAEWIGSDFSIDNSKPVIELVYPELFKNGDKFEPNIIRQYLLSHPAIKSLDKQIDVNNVGIELAKQKYKPQWGVSASYGYRDNEPSGRERTDFFSVGVTFDLPIFTSNRQDKALQSAVADAEAIKTDKLLLLRQMDASFKAARTKFLRLNQRYLLYQTRLLKEMEEQTNTLLNAYTHDDGSFIEVIRAQIEELNAKIEALDIEVERMKTIIQLNYYFYTANS